MARMNPPYLSRFVFLKFHILTAILISLLIHSVNGQAKKKTWYDNPAIWDFQWSTNQWTYLEKATVEVSRTAVIGAVLIQKYAPPGPVLDIGCGTGVLSDFLNAEQKKQYIGIDFSKEAIAIALRQRNLTFIHTKAEEYEPSTTSFACIAFNEVLYYVDFEKTLQKYTKYLLPNGIIIISKYHDNTRNGKTAIDPTLQYAKSTFRLIEELKLSGLTPGNDNKTSAVTFRMAVFKLK